MNGVLDKLQAAAYARLSRAISSLSEVRKRAASRRKRVTSRPNPQGTNGGDGGADALADVESNPPVGTGGGAREPIDGGGVNLAGDGGVAGDAVILVEGSPHGINGRVGFGDRGGGSGNDGDGGGVNPTQDGVVAVSTLIMGLVLPFLVLGDFLTPREAVLLGVFVMLSFVVDYLHRVGFLHGRVKIAMYSITWFLFSGVSVGEAAA